MPTEYAGAGATPSFPQLGGELAQGSCSGQLADRLGRRRQATDGAAPPHAASHTLAGQAQAYQPARLSTNH